MSFKYGSIRQVGYVVSDIHEAIAHWRDEVGVGPFFLFEDAPLQDLRFRGEPCDARVAIALAQSGHVQIELIMPLDDQPSLYREHLQQHGEGPQHVAYWTEDFAGLSDRARESGLVEVWSGYTGDPKGRFVYFQSPSHPGSCVEISALSQAKRELFDSVERAALDWDGRPDKSVIPMAPVPAPVA